ncbi:MAG: alpha/beta fold hydrolase [Chloroflexi bacterium]|nr:alpha/beta fold hydrolase [Chloroflexota bacterium]MBU1751277.1 alpha/beta fold hydrolase [Chloroflexota bacterium]MBU1877536.1 alpha/beta fold hydrolase [Chloroflexota bacterium]
MAWNPHLDLTSFYFPGGPVGCLLVHGFTGSPPEMRGLGEYLAAQGYTVRGPLLPGHGTSPEDMAITGAADWLGAAEADLHRLQAECDAVFVAGLSMGGVISLILASEYSVAGVVALSTPSHLVDWRVRLLPALRHVMRWVPSNSVPTTDLTDQAAPGRLCSYPRTPTACVVELNRLIGRMRQALPRVTAPALIIQSTGDRHIPPASGQFIYDHLGSADKVLRVLHNSGHAITVDSEREAVWRAVDDFIRARCPAPKGGDPRLPMT